MWPHLEPGVEAGGVEVGVPGPVSAPPRPHVVGDELVDGGVPGEAQELITPSLSSQATLCHVPTSSMVAAACSGLVTTSSYLTSSTRPGWRELSWEAVTRSRVWSEHCLDSRASNEGLRRSHIHEEGPYYVDFSAKVRLKLY